MQIPQLLNHGVQGSLPVATGGFEESIPGRRNANSKQKLNWRIEQIFLKQVNNPMFHYSCSRSPCSASPSSLVTAITALGKTDYQHASEMRSDLKRLQRDSGSWRNVPTTQHVTYAARSFTSADVADLAQCAQQKKRPLTSTPCPMTLHLQCSQTGARAWIAHSKLSNVCRAPAAISSKLLS